MYGNSRNNINRASTSSAKPDLLLYFNIIEADEISTRQDICTDLERLKEKKIKSIDIFKEIKNASAQNLSIKDLDLIKR